jgi:hypothetical protein
MLTKSDYRITGDREYQEMLDSTIRDNRIQRRLEAEGWGCVSAEKAYVHSIKGSDFLLRLEEIVLEYSCVCADKFGIPRNSDVFREMLQRNSNLASSFVARSIFYGRTSQKTKLACGALQLVQQFVDEKEDIMSISDGGRFEKFLRRKCFA